MPFGRVQLIITFPVRFFNQSPPAFRKALSLLLVSPFSPDFCSIQRTILQRNKNTYHFFPSQLLSWYPEAFAFIPPHLAPDLPLYQPAFFPLFFFQLIESDHSFLPLRLSCPYHIHVSALPSGPHPVPPARLPTCCRKFNVYNSIVYSLYCDILFSRA